MLVLQIKVKEGITGDKEDDAKRNDISQHQKDLLIELGVKISKAKYLLIIGSQIIFKSPISYLFDFRCYHVCHHYILN